jgi:hypothetical protein
MFRFIKVCVCLLAGWTSVGVASGQSVSDAALAECQGDGARFTVTKHCLPGAEVGLRMIEAIALPEHFGEAGAWVGRECSAINDRSVSRWACARAALIDASALLSIVGAADRVADPRFASLARPEALDRVLALEETLQRSFPGAAFLAVRHFGLR